MFVVFDEAHHAGAYTYYNLIKKLQSEYRDMYLLGLTATPKRSDNAKKIDGTLKELFPQGNLYKIGTDRLIAQNILAKPIYEQPKRTDFIPEFPEDMYKKWINTHRDIPEKIITQLADNAERNEYIADTYYRNREKYGKTIIFADRWFQCIAIRDFINKKYSEDKNVSSDDKRRKEEIAGAVYHHVKSDYVSTSSATSDNIKVLEDFKDNKLDVIVNIRMLTEGTDVPNAQTVFLTRQTTSEILMTQMVGRALRGPKFNGTAEAFIVPFIDDWRQKIIWVPPDIIEGEFIPSPGVVGDFISELVSVSAVEGLVDELYSGDVSFDSYLQKYIPVGWYQTEYEGIPIEWYQNIDDGGLKYQTEFYGNINEDENHILINNLIMVFENQIDPYKKFIHKIKESDITKFKKKDIKFTEYSGMLQNWYDNFFSEDIEFGTDILKNLFYIVCHTAQKGEPPRFFNFEKREEHDLDKYAIKLKTMNPPLDQMMNEISKEYHREDLYWNSIYQHETDFQKHVMIRFIVNPTPPPIKTEEEIQCEKLENGSLQEKISACKVLGELSSKEPLHEKTIKLLRLTAQNSTNSYLKEAASNALKKIEPDTPDRDRILLRDNNKCLCCGEDRKASLQIDHIVPRWLKDDNSDANLQTLCRSCNGEKGKKIIDFSSQICPLEEPSEFPNLKKLYYFEKDQVQDFKYLEKFIRRKINFFYQCNAVDRVEIGTRGQDLLNWRIKLHKGNDPLWIRPFMRVLADEIHLMRDYYSLKGPNNILIR